MNKYEVLINVDRIYLSIKGKTKLMGYFQTIYIDADSENDAENKAVDRVNNDVEIENIWIKEKQINPPEILIEEIIELQSINNQFDDLGKTFYNIKNWWEFWKN